ncbi:MAG: hypothetical protein ABSE77_06640 [Acidimicrobiales bacterium]|jgi:FlaG/FlaF family flagellin (archaellin)
MIVILGLVLLVAAVVVGVAGVFATMAAPICDDLLDQRGAARAETARVTPADS